MPNYLPFSNGLSPMRAGQIARLFGDDLQTLSREFADANTYGAQQNTRADTQGNGLGMYPNAEHLFFGWLYDMHYEGACDGQAAARREQYDD